MHSVPTSDLVHFVDKRRQHWHGWLQLQEKAGRQDATRDIIQGTEHRETVMTLVIEHYSD